MHSGLAGTPESCSTQPPPAMCAGVQAGTAGRGITPQSCASSPRVEHTLHGERASATLPGTLARPHPPLNGGCAMLATEIDSAALEKAAAREAANIEVQRKEALLKTGALQSAILNSANFSIIAPDEKGIIHP